MTRPEPPPGCVNVDVNLGDVCDHPEHRRVTVQQIHPDGRVVVKPAAAGDRLEVVRADELLVIKPWASIEADTVEFLVAKMHRQDAAKQRYQAEVDAQCDPAPLDAGLLADLLDKYDDEPPERVGGLIPSQAGTLVSAQRKTGKTTLLLNLVRCLLTGQDFLNGFPVRAVEGRIAYLNFEVSGATFTRWAEQVDVPIDRLYVVNLRGKPNPLADPNSRVQLATRLREHKVETVIVDPFGRAYTGSSQNDPGEVGAWLNDLDLFCRSEAGAVDVVLAAHAGWNRERTRGASALEDWADSIVRLTRNDDGDRFLSAEGRDVDVAEDRLLFDPPLRRLAMSGSGGRASVAAASKADGVVDRLVQVVAEHPAISANDLRDALGVRRDVMTAAARLAEKRGLITRTKIGRVTHHELSRPTTPDDARGAVVNHAPRLPLGGAGVVTSEGAVEQPRPGAS